MRASHSWYFSKKKNWKVAIENLVSWRHDINSYIEDVDDEKTSGDTYYTASIFQCLALHRTNKRFFWIRIRWVRLNSWLFSPLFRSISLYLCTLVTCTVRSRLLLCFFSIVCFTRPCSALLLGSWVRVWQHDALLNNLWHVNEMQCNRDIEKLFVI